MSTGAINLDSQGYTAFRGVGENVFKAGRNVQLKDKNGNWSERLEIKHIADLGNGLYSMRMKGKDGREWTLTISMQRQSQTSQSDSNRVQRRPEYDNRVAQWIYDHTRGLESLGNYAQSHPGEALAVGLGGGLLIAAAPIAFAYLGIGAGATGADSALATAESATSASRMATMFRYLKTAAKAINNRILTSSDFVRASATWRSYIRLGINYISSGQSIANLPSAVRSIYTGFNETISKGAVSFSSGSKVLLGGVSLLMPKFVINWTAKSNFFFGILPGFIP